MPAGSRSQRIAALIRQMPRARRCAGAAPLGFAAQLSRWAWRWFRGRPGELWECAALGRRGELSRMWAVSEGGRAFAWWAWGIARGACVWRGGRGAGAGKCGTGASPGILLRGRRRQ